MLSAGSDDKSMKAKDIIAETNRGMLLDVVVFIINLALMNLLTEYFIDLFRLAGEDDAFAMFVLLVCTGGCWSCRQPARFLSVGTSTSG